MNTMNVEQLTELRETVHTSVRQLEDLRSKQALSTNQQKALDRYIVQRDQLDAQITEARTIEDAETRAALERRNQAVAELGGVYMGSTEVMKRLAINNTMAFEQERRASGRNRDCSRMTGYSQQSGSALRSFGLGDDIRSLRPRVNEPSLGAVVRGMAIGDWSHLTSEQRSLISTGAAAAIPGASVLDIQEQAMQQSVVFAAGARMVNIDKPSEKVARVISTGAPEWLPDTADRSLSDQSIVISPADLTAFSAWLYTSVSIETLEDATGLDDAIVSAFSRQLAVLYDQAALSGDGIDMPTGLCWMDHVQDGVIEVPSWGTLDDHSPFVYAAGQVFGAHHKPSSVMIRPEAWTTLAMLTDSTRQPIQPPKAYTNLSEHVTDFLLPGHALVADWSKYLFGTRTAFTLEVSRTGTGFKKGFVEIRAYVRFGGIPLDPAAFCLISGLETGESS